VPGELFIKLAQRPKILLDGAFGRKRGAEARLPARAADVLGRPGAWSFGPTLWSTSVMTRRTAGIGG
jgi:hypothetical protein